MYLTQVFLWGKINIEKINCARKSFLIQKLWIQ